MTRPPEPNYEKLPDDREHLLDRPIATLGDLATIVGGSSNPRIGQLLDLMVAADMGMRARLASAFPYEHGMLSCWEATADPPTWRELHAAYVARRAAEGMGEQPC